MYKLFNKIFIICMTCFLLSGCASKNNDVVIKFSTWGSASEMKILKPIISDFEKQNPNVKIELIHIPQDYFRKLHLLLASNMAPDVIFINNLNIVRYKNLLTDLSKDINKSEYFTQSIECMSVDNKLYAVPRDVSNLVVYYNKDIFKKYSLKYPNKNWSIYDLIKMSKMTSKNGIYGISYEPDMYYVLPYMKYFGGGILNSDGKYTATDESSQKGIRLYQDIVYKYKTAPTPAQKGSKTSAQMFLEGKLAMHLSGRWLVPKYRECANFDWDIVNFPHCASPSDSSGWAVSKSSKHKDLAIKFILFLSNKTNITQMTKDGLIVPARIDVAHSKEFLKGKPEHSQLFIYSVENSKPTNTSKDYTKLSDELTDKIFSTK